MIKDLLLYTGTKTVVSETVCEVQGTVFRSCFTSLVVLGGGGGGDSICCGVSKFSDFCRGERGGFRSFVLLRS